MTFTDGIQSSLKFFPTNKKDSHRKLKRLNKSIINLLPHHRQQSAKHSKSPPSNLPKSVTFASVFDDQFVSTIKIL